MQASIDTHFHRGALPPVRGPGSRSSPLNTAVKTDSGARPTRRVKFGKASKSDKLEKAAAAEAAAAEAAAVSGGSASNGRARQGSSNGSSAQPGGAYFSAPGGPARRSSSSGARSSGGAQRQQPAALAVPSQPTTRECSAPPWRQATTRAPSRGTHPPRSALGSAGVLFGTNGGDDQGNSARR